MFKLRRRIEARIGNLRIEAFSGYYLHWDDLQPFEEFEDEPLGNSEQLRKFLVTHVMVFRGEKKLDPEAALIEAAKYIPGQLQAILSLEDLRQAHEQE